MRKNQERVANGIPKQLGFLLIPYYTVRQIIMEPLKNYNRGKHQEKRPISGRNDSTGGTGYHLFKPVRK